jgi:hypothetical protein
VTAAIERKTLSGRRCWATVAGFVLGNAICGIVLARGGVSIQEAGFSPFLLFRVLVGVLIGAAACFLAAQMNVRGFHFLLIAAVCGAATCILFEHVFFYLDYRAGFSSAAQKNPTAALFQAAGELQPANFIDFMLAGANRGVGFPGWAQWLLDAILTIVAATAFVWFVERQRATPAAQSETCT